ncbi:hypothetical protein [Thermococcus sp.]|uniref:hypothetical protein n=1 Tax=Thermococcus sp. TaxID=35749 RepID=UPI0026317595|nr:hypothetical protein [Thermococcus sp.]
MNIFIPLLLGVVLGYILRSRGKRPNLEKPTSLALLLMIFFLGVKTGEVNVNGLWLLGTSILFAIFTAGGSLLLALGVRG